MGTGLLASTAAAARATGLNRFLNDGKGVAQLPCLCGRAADDMHGTIRNVVFGGSAPPRALGLLFCLLHDDICWCAMQVHTGKSRIVDELFLLDFLSLGCLACLRDAADEADEPVTIAIRRNGGDLGFGIGKSFEEVLAALDEVVLSKVLVVRH